MFEAPKILRIFERLSVEVLLFILQFQLEVNVKFILNSTATVIA